MTNDQFIDWLHGYMIAAPHLLPRSVRDELNKLIIRRNVPRVLPNPIVISKKEAPPVAPYIPGTVPNVWPNRLPNQAAPSPWPRHDEWMNRPFLEEAKPLGFFEGVSHNPRIY